MSAKSIAVADPASTGDTAGKLADDTLQREKQLRRRKNIRLTLLLVAVAGCLWFTGLLDGNRLSEGVPAIGVLLGEMLPPDFTRWREWSGPLVDTVAMSVAGTALAIGLSLPLAILAAPNTSPNPWVRYFARTILNGLRAIPELIMGIVFVAAVGFGMLPGVLALGLHSVGMVGKFFAEAIEHAHQAPLEAAEAAGATRLQVIHHAVFPQVLPQFTDVTMYRWEYNFRASTVMGMVGAGGIGTELMSSLRILDYAQVGGILIVILLAVAVVDGLSNWLRARLT